MFRPMMGSAFGAPGFPHDMMRDLPPEARRRQTASNSGGLTTEKVQEMINESLGKVTDEAVAKAEANAEAKAMAEGGVMTADKVQSMVNDTINKAVNEAVANARTARSAEQKAAEDAMASAVQKVQARHCAPAADEARARVVSNLAASLKQ